MPSPLLDCSRLWTLGASSLGASIRSKGEQFLQML